MTGDKIYLVEQESNVDGELYFYAYPCSTFEKAKEVLERVKQEILSVCIHYKSYTKEELEENFEIEENNTRWFINDPCDDYYEELTIIEKVVE